MTNRSKRHTIVDPRGHRTPLFIRLCEAFVDNLANILRLGLVVGALFLVRDLAELRELVLPRGDAPLVSEQADVIEPLEPAAGEEEPWLSDGVKHALNCTHEDYRNAHYDDCVDDASEIYKRPGADPDDTGFILRESEVLFAGLGSDQALP
jgi:hypothetical protein